MPRRSKRSQPSPEASWVLEGDVSNSMSESDIDGDESSPSSTENSKGNTTAKPSPKRRSAPSGHKAHESRSPPIRKSSRPAAEPQLVMPSMNVSQSTMSQQAISAAAHQVRKRTNRLPVQSTTQRHSHDVASDHSHDQGPSFYMRMLWAELLYPILDFTRIVISYIFMVLKPTLAVCVAVWILAFLARRLVSVTLSRAPQTLLSLCNVPGISSFNLPFCAVAPVSGPAEFDELMRVQSSFEDVLSSSVNGATLPVDMKRSESSIRDLRHVVEFSTLPSRNELVFEFGGFIDAARQASADLTRYNSRIGRAVDNIISTNRWTLQVIDGVAEREASRGSIGRFLQGTLLYPFQSAVVSEDLLLDQYLKHTRVIEERIGELIVEAQTLLGILHNLDDRLDVIHSISTRDGISLKGSRDELLAQLWTKLGGNRSSKKKHNEQIQLLEQVSMYRRTAWDHVSGTLLKLQAIAAGLEDLRERVAAPDVLGPRSEVPLQMHIEHIQLGVERLETQRGEARHFEAEQQRRVLHKGETSPQLQLST